MRMWIIGGTSEGVRLAKSLDPRTYIVSVVTEESLEFLPQEAEVHVGAMDQNAMEDFIMRHEICAVIDMSHPFAKIVSKEGKAAAEECKIPYYRYRRPLGEGGDLLFKDYDSCANYISKRTGTFYFTTGSKHSDLFESVRGESRHIYRVIPSEKSIHILKEAGVEMKDMVAMLGPFDYDMNYALFKHAEADYLVTKNSGEGSGFYEKIWAAKDLNLTSLVISTEGEEGYDFDELSAVTERISNEILLSLLHQ